MTMLGFDADREESKLARLLRFSVFLKLKCNIFRIKVECVIWPEFRMGQYRDEDHGKTHPTLIIESGTVDFVHFEFFAVLL